MQKFSYHTHSNFSDGECSLEEIFEQAENLGWEEIGITDHLIIHRNIRQSPSYPMLIKDNGGKVYRHNFESAVSDFQRQGEHFRKVSSHYSIKAYLGYEVDYFTYEGWEDEFKDFIKQIDHDYLITGNHFFSSEDGLKIYDIYRYQQLHEDELGDKPQNFLRRHYQTLCKAVESNLFEFLAHLDYARKSGLHEKFPMVEERLQVVSSLLNSGTAIELSTKGLRNINGFYPEESILQEIIRQKIPVVISDDAHRREELGYEFEKAEKWLNKLNCQQRYRLKLC